MNLNLFLNPNLTWVETPRFFALLLMRFPEFSCEMQPAVPNRRAFFSNGNVLSLKIVNQIQCGYALPKGFPIGGKRRIQFPNILHFILKNDSR